MKHRCDAPFIVRFTIKQFKYTTMRMHKMGPDEIKLVTEFVQAAELMLEGGKWSLKEPYQKWEECDEDDDDREEIEALRKRIAREEDMREEYIDGRIIAYEYLRRKYTHRLQVAAITADMLIDQCCDPLKTYLDFHPAIEWMHVAPEQ